MQRLLQDKEYQRVDKVLGQIDNLKNVVRVENLSAMVEKCHGLVESQAKQIYDCLYHELMNAKTLAEIDALSVDALEAMDKQIPANKASYIYLQNIRDFRENCKQAIEKRDKVSFKDRMQLDNHLIYSLYQKFETQVVLLNDQMEVKEVEIRRLQEQLAANPDSDELKALLQRKQAELDHFKEKSQGEIETMQSEYARQMARKETSCQNELRDLKVLNQSAIQEKEGGLLKCEADLESNSASKDQAANLVLQNTIAKYKEELNALTSAQHDLQAVEKDKKDVNLYIKDKMQKLFDTLN